jgi:hypothetical protein
MADEIKASVRLSVTKGNLKLAYGGTTRSITMAGVKGGNPGTVNIGTSDEAISLGDIGSAGYAYFRNLDATNYVEIGPTVAGAIAPFLRLAAGEESLVKLTPAVALRGQANTAACNVLIAVIEA